MKTVLLLGGPADGQRREIHGVMASVYAGEDQGTLYKVVPLCSHGEVHWFGVLDGADPLALLIDGYGAGKKEALLANDMLAQSQRQTWELQSGLRALIYGTLLDEAGNRNDDGLRDYARSGSVSEKVVGAWLKLAESTLMEGSK